MLCICDLVTINSFITVTAEQISNKLQIVLLDHKLKQLSIAVDYALCSVQGTFYA